MCICTGMEGILVYFGYYFRIYRHGDAYIGWEIIGELLITYAYEVTLSTNNKPHPKKPTI